MRDFGVERFEIQGEGWIVNYRLAEAQDVNAQLQSNPDVIARVKGDPKLADRYTIRHDWLIADIRQTQPTGKNAYIIETSAPSVNAALDQLLSLGVSRENPYLQNLDFQNQHGKIKWLPVTPEQLSDDSAIRQKPTEGRLFINGQVMNFKDKGKTAQDYWKGPEYATIALNDVNYEMSIDRPPISPLQLGIYIDKLVDSMTKDQLIDQLHRSEHIWSQVPDDGYSWERKGCYVLINKIVDQLPRQGYDKTEYTQVFNDRNYLARDTKLSDEDIQNLREQGYTFCPPYFAEIGMPRASSKLETLTVAKKEKPQLSGYRKELVAQEYGMEVAYEDLSTTQTVQDFFTTVRDRLGGVITAIEPRAEGSHTIRIKFNAIIPDALITRALSKPKDEAQKLLYFLRGTAFYGMDRNIFTDFILSQGNYVTTFDITQDEIEGKNLVARNIKHPAEGVFIEFDLAEQYAQAFKEIFEKEVIGSAPKTPLSTGDKVLGTPSTTQKGRIGENEGRPNSLIDAINGIPVNQPDFPKDTSEPEVIQKPSSISEEEKDRLKKMEAQLPGIMQAVETLNELIPEHPIEEKDTGKSPLEKYVEWRKSDNFYGQLGANAGYMTGKHLIELIDEQNQADISVAKGVEEPISDQQSQIQALQQKLDAIVKRMNIKEDDVNDFEFVFDPAERQLAQFGLLQLYTHITTGVALPNDFFLYRGTGSKGINLAQKAIGLHEALFDVKFTEALRTFTHEVAHNYPEATDHGNMFRHAMESLFVTMNDRITQIATKLNSDGTATQEDEIILDIEKQWNKLKGV